MQKYTVYETGSVICISKGEWNCPRDGYAARPGYWLRLHDREATFAGPLYVGEYVVLEANSIPLDIRLSADLCFDKADRSARPWAY